MGGFKASPINEKELVLKEQAHLSPSRFERLLIVIRKQEEAQN